MKTILPTEAEEQMTLIKWTNLKGYPYNLLFFIPNGGMYPVQYRVKLKKMGVRPGVLDLFMPLPVYREGEHWCGLFIELKRQKGGSLSVEQKERISQLVKAGYRVAVCKGWEAAKNEIERYLGGR